MKLHGQRDYPKSISYMGEEYTVKFVRKFADKDQVGEFDPSERVIRIKSGMSKEDIAVTVIHELLHMGEEEAKVKISHRDIYKLSEFLVQLLIEN